MYNNVRKPEGIDKEELIKSFLDVERKLGKIPPSTHLEMYGLPPVAKFNQEFGSWNKFLQSAGKKVSLRQYKRKQNLKRFFYPQEWLKFLQTIENQDHKFWFELLLHTGARIDEARAIQVKDVNLERETLVIKKPKRSLGATNKQREIEISTYIKNRMVSYVKQKNLGKFDTFGIPSTQFMDKVIKQYCEKAGIEDYYDFSCHNLRKTCEQYLIALNVNVLSVQAHIGHTIDVIFAHYVGTSLFKMEDKILIRTIMDNLFNKQGGYQSP